MRQQSGLRHLTIFHGALERNSISKGWKNIRYLCFLFKRSCLPSLSCFEHLIRLGYEPLCLWFSCASSTAMTQPGLTGEALLRRFLFPNRMFLDFYLENSEFPPLLPAQTGSTGVTDYKGESVRRMFCCSYQGWLWGGGKEVGDGRGVA